MVKNAAWPQNSVDRFILARLEGKGLSPSLRADKRTLIRRATFDLTGLPPTLAEVESFQADTTPSSYERIIDRLLASPRYGERWARYWLDVARYADTKGYILFQEADYHRAYTYRDYVIGAFNHDLSYDRFLIEQIAADRIPPEQGKRPLPALGFLTVGARFMGNIHDVIDDRMDVVFAAESAGGNITRPINPVVARGLATRPPRSLAEAASVYARLLGNVEQVWQDVECRATLDGRTPSPLPVPALESLRQVFHGPASPPNIVMLDCGDLGLLPDCPSQARLRALRNAVRTSRSRVISWSDLPPNLVAGNPSLRRF